jgi:hypothetical protein
MPGDVGLVAKLLSEIFGFVVDPDGLARLQREHEMEVIRAGLKIALDRNDIGAADQLYQRLRELSACPS